jgi:hypothetical protein
LEKKQMKKTVFVIALGVFSPIAFASTNWESKYWEYANTIGDATPLSQYEWGVRNGFLKDDSRKERIVLSKEDQAEIVRLNTFGDGTPPVEVALSTGPRRALTPSEVEYIRFSSTYGDATPPSYEAWKASKRK